MKSLLPLATILGLLLGPTGLSAGVLINELFYHPASEDVREEWIELYNPDPAPVNLAGWHLAAGVRITLPAVTLPARGFLVIAADTNRFAELHPGVANVVGNWTGILSNSGEEVRLEDNLTNVVSQVTYADEGDWAQRVLGPPDYGYRGWDWQSEADGLGKSLELINPALPNSHGQNWAASTTTGGTPGTGNSTAAANVAPFILEARHRPLLPSSSDPVTLTCRVLNEQSAGLTVTLWQRLDGSPDFTSAPMFDDGAHGDGFAGDGTWGIVLRPRGTGTIMEFYFRAEDAEGLSRTWPAQAVSDGVPAQIANCLYQVIDDPYPGDQQVLYLILKEADRSTLAAIGRSSLSDAQFNGTLVSVDGAGTELRHLVGVRNRGHGSRNRLPNNHRINFRSDQPWHGVSAINVNGQQTYNQIAGAALWHRAGVPALQARPVQLRVNGRNLIFEGASPSLTYGSYALVEVLNGEFANRQFPDDDSGNLYRGKRVVLPGANLRYQGESADDYRTNYLKYSNESEDDYTDLIELVRVLNETPDASYAAEVRRVVNVEEWLRNLALNALVDNSETSLSSGYGDDYWMYRGVSDPRFQIGAYDLDTIFGIFSGATNATLFKADAIPALSKFMRWPEFVPIYYRQLKELAETVFAPASINAVLEETIGGHVPAAVLDSMRAFARGRSAWVLSQIPQQLTVDTNVLPIVDGYPQSTAATVQLHGQANAIETRRVLVNGEAAQWNAVRASWTNQAVTLLPGLNRVLIQSLNESGGEVERLNYDVWFDDGSAASVSGTIAANTTWAAGAGPFNVTANLTVASGATLTIEPGTTVLLAAGANLTVANGGRLLAEGTEQRRIRFTRPPGSTAAWGGIVVNGTVGSPESRIAYADLEFNGTTAIHSDGGTVVIDNLTFGTTTEQYVSLDDSSFIVSHCHFPAATAGFELAHGTGGIKAGGHGIFRHNFFGAAQGYNDVIDFTGGKRPGSILQVINNVFAGSGDDILDLDGTDAWVEGNIFLHVHKNGSPDSASAVSGGSDGGRVSEVTIIGNLFYDCDHAATAKQGNFYTLINNTIVRQTKQGGLDTDAAVVNFSDEGTTEGAGMHLEGNVIVDAEKLVRGATTAVVTFANNLMPLPWTGPGGGNSAADPLLNHIPELSETQFTSFTQAQVLREWFSLWPGSPANGAGFNGRDLGGVGTLGSSLGGEPEGTTSSTSATLTVGLLRSAGLPWPSGFTHYRWRLDDGPWSAETPTAAPVSLNDLTAGAHLVEVTGRNDGGLYQDDPRLGEEAFVTRSRTWTVDPSYVAPTAPPSIWINEVLAGHSNSADPDRIELFNFGASTVSLAGMGLSDTATEKFKFTFPVGTTLAPGQFLVLFGDKLASPPGLHAGFGLKAEGDQVFLHDTLAKGGRLLDSVEYGSQVPDLSIGRLSGGVWSLNQPTLGSANLPQPTGDAHNLRINEWLAANEVLFRNDFVELHNPGALPVALDGVFLTDNLPVQPHLHALPPLSFIGAGGYLRLTADGQPQQGGDHLNFKLASEVGQIALTDANGVIDAVSYIQQRTDISRGRSPDGSEHFAFFPQPTPGAANPGSAFQFSTNSLSLITRDNLWNYSATGDDLGTTWHAIGYAEPGWLSGRGTFYHGNNADRIPGPINTTLPFTNPEQLTFYFRTHFTAPAVSAGDSLILSHVLDDGAAFWLNGQLLTSYNLPAGATYSTRASSSVNDASAVGPITLPANLLQPGDNVLAVEVHQSSSSSSDIAFAASLALVTVSSNRINTPIVLNEVLVDNRSLANEFGHAGWVELFNPSDAPVDLTGLSLTDDLAQSRKWMAPAGTTLPADARLVIFCDPTKPAGTNNTGFALDARGGGVYLFDAQVRGGPLLDSVTFGLQVADLSIGRINDGDGAWLLTLATPGTANTGAPLGTPAALRINEWLADPLEGEDWFEIFNPEPNPVALGGLFLTDDPAKPRQSPVPPLTFLGAGAFVQVFADDNAGAGANHARFKLKAGGEAIALFSPSGDLLEGVEFFAQAAGTSEGRLPNGAATFARFFPPTPGLPNAGTNDSDGDGLPDSWENDHGLNRNDPNDALVDTDGDGLSNRDEYLSGTDPQNANDTLSLDLATGAAGEVGLSFRAVAGHSYSVYRRDDLAGGTWQKLADVPAPAVSGPVSVPDPAPAPDGGFYRVVTPAQP